MAAVRIVGTLAMLLAGVQAVTVQSEVQSKVRDHTPPKKTNAFMVTQDGFLKLQDGTLEDPHIHGSAGHYWKWIKPEGKDWTRETVSDADAKAVIGDKASSAPAPTNATTPNTGSIAKSVNMDVYYETRCPGCLLFINQTLEPLWRNKDLKGVLNVTMYTYGNGITIPTANVSEGYKFWHPETTGKGWDNVQICQHGSDECLGNLVQVCAKDIADNDKYMELIFCMAATTIAGYGEEKSTYECMQKADIDHDKVKECVTSPHGNNLVTEAGRQTHLLKSREGTPWVMVAGTHVENDLLVNSTLLLQSLCSHVGDVPLPCAPWKKAAPAAPAKAAAPSDDGDDFQVFEKDLIKVSRDHV